jgi:hypothetical protein
LAFQKSVRTPKKKVIGSFFGNCLRMQKPLMKFKKFLIGTWLLGVGPDRANIPPLPQNRLCAC